MESFKEAPIRGDIFTGVRFFSFVVYLCKKHKIKSLEKKIKNKEYEIDRIKAIIKNIKETKK